MKPLIAILLVATLGCVTTGATRAQSTLQADSQQIAVADYTVFVDPPTGFVFVKLPQGWKFAGKVEPVDVARLPDNVVTALLKPDTAEVAQANSRGAEGWLGTVD